MNLKIALGAIILLAAAWFGRDLLRDDVETGRLVSAERGALTLKVDAAGVLDATQSDSITPPRVDDMWRFQISYMAPEGGMVQPGQPVMRFDAKQLTERLDKDQSQLAEARKSLEISLLDNQEKLEAAELALAEAVAERTKAKNKAEKSPDLVAAAELAEHRLDAELAGQKEQINRTKLAIQKRNMEAEVNAQKALIEVLERRVAKLQTDIERLNVKAGRPGMVVYKPKWDGSKFAVGETTWVGNVIMLIPDLSEMKVKAQINEPDAGKVQVGQIAEIRLDAAPDRPFTGKITELGKVFRPKSNTNPTIVFDATILIDEPDTALMRPGMAAKLKIHTRRLDDVLHIPKDAVAYDEQGPFVLDLKGVKRRVQLGQAIDDHVEITQGLVEGDRIQMGAGQMSPNPTEAGS